jgi:hypothetical protein
MMEWIRKALKAPAFKTKQDMQRFYAEQEDKPVEGYDVVHRLQEIFKPKPGEMGYPPAYYGNLELWHSLKDLT